MATDAHTEHPGGGKPQFPPFNKETFASQLVWFAVFFIALYVLIGRFAIPPLRPNFEGLTYLNPSAVLTMTALFGVSAAALLDPARRSGRVGLVGDRDD